MLDAQLAALAIEHGLAVYSADTDFARFTELTWVNSISPRSWLKARRTEPRAKCVILSSRSLSTVDVSLTCRGGGQWLSGGPCQGFLDHRAVGV